MLIEQNEVKSILEKRRSSKRFSGIRKKNKKSKPKFDNVLLGEKMSNKLNREKNEKMKKKKFEKEKFKKNIIEKEKFKNMNYNYYKKKKIKIIFEKNNFIIPEKILNLDLLNKLKKKHIFFKNIPNPEDKYICIIISDGINIKRNNI